MMERFVNGAHSTLRRAEGVTVADRLGELYPPKTKGLFKKRLEPQTLPESVDLRFESIPLCEVFPDRTHVVAVGDDGERLYLIRDRRVLYTASKEEVSKIELIQQSKNFNYLLFTTAHQTGGGAIHIVVPDGDIRTPLIYSVQGGVIRFGETDEDNTDSQRRWDFSWCNTYLLAAQDADKTRLVVCDGLGNVTRSIEVPETHDVTNICVEETDDSFSKIVWQAYPSKEEATLGAHSYVYLNDKLLAENPDYQHVQCSPDLSRVLTWTKDPPRISVNDRDVLNEESGEITGHACNEDLTVAAFAIKAEEKKVRIFYVTPEGAQMYDEPFEEVRRLRVRHDNSIGADVKRNGGVSWELTIDPQKQPSAREVELQFGSFSRPSGAC